MLISAPGKSSWKEDQAGDSLFIILEGVVEISKNLVKADLEQYLDEEKQNFCKTGCTSHAVFGEIGLLGNQKGPRQ